MNSVTYILWSEDVDYCVLVDCGEFEPLVPVLNQISKKVKSILLTHGHFDHISGLKKLIEIEPSLVIYGSKETIEALGDSKKNLSRYAECSFSIADFNAILVEDKMVIHFDGLTDFEVISTPGHSPGCMTYKSGNDLYTGDAYIPGLDVITNFPKGNKQQALQTKELISSMEQKGCVIHCGHHSYEKLLKQI